MKKQPFYKKDSPLNQFPDPIKLLRTKFGGKSNPGDLNNSTSPRGALASHRYHNTPPTSSFGERVTNTINSLFNLNNEAPRTQGKTLEVDTWRNENVRKEEKKPVVSGNPVTPVVLGNPEKKTVIKNKKPVESQYKDEGSGGGGGINTSFMKDYSLGEDSNIKNAGIDLVKNSAKGILTRHGGSTTRDGKLMKTYDSDVSASGKAGRKARKQMKKDDKMAGLTRPERRERKLMAKAMASQRAAGLNFTAGDNMSAEIGEVGQAMLSPSQSSFTTEREAGLDYGGKARKKGMRLINKTNQFIDRQRGQVSQGSSMEPGIRKPQTATQSLTEEISNRGDNPTQSIEINKISSAGQKIQDKIAAGSSYKPTSPKINPEDVINKIQPGRKEIQLPGSSISRGDIGSGIYKTGPIKNLSTGVVKGKVPTQQVKQKQAFYKKGPLLHVNPNDPGHDPSIKHKQNVEGVDVGGNDSTTYDSKSDGYGIDNKAVTNNPAFKNKNLSDFPMNSQLRKDYYTARGLAQDYTTELKINSGGEDSPDSSSQTKNVEMEEKNTGVEKENTEVVEPQTNKNTNQKPKKQKMGLISEEQAGVFFKKGPLNTIKKIVRR